MKTIQKGDEIKRVSDEEGFELATKGWKLVPKSVWKAKVRPPKKAEVKVEKAPDKGKSKYKAKKEKQELVYQK